MARIIKLTESDLTRIIKRVIMEQTPKELSDGKMKSGCYTVKSGDQLLVIAKKFGITLDDIKSLNGLKNTNIKPGQKLRVRNGVKFIGC
jgi:membrane-bound lytic murein transglycosylase D